MFLNFTERFINLSRESTAIFTGEFRKDLDIFLREPLILVNTTKSLQQGLCISKLKIEVPDSVVI